CARRRCCACCRTCTADSTRHGTRAISQDHGRPLRAERQAEEDEAMDGDRPNRFPLPPIIYLLAIAIGVLLNLLYPFPWLGQLSSMIFFAIGWLMIAAFVALNISAIHVMRRAGTTVRPDRGTAHLVTDGPFRFTRNPLYLAGTMLVLGIGLVSGIVWFLL